MESQADEGSLQAIRIAIVLDSVIPAAWIAAVIQSIVRDFGLQAVVVLPERKLAPKHSYLFERYLAWDARRTSNDSNPLAAVDVSDLLSGLKVTTLASLGANIDVLLWLSETNPADFPFVSSTYGTWFLHHGDLTRASLTTASPWAAYFPELAGQHPVSSSYLLAITKPEERPVTLAEAHTASEIGWSLARQRTAPFWKAATLPRAALKRLGKRTAASALANLPARGSVHAPTNTSVLAFAARNLVRTANRRFRYGNKEAHWFVSYRTNREDFVAQRGQFSNTGFRVLDTPKDHFYADPFVLTWQNRTFLFVEDYLYAEARGVLSVLELLSDGHFSPAQEILNRPYHLSYPFVFEHEGDVFMIPETMAARRIELYRALEMPHRWEFVKVLQDNVEAVDTTLWVQDGVFYFFTNMVQPGLTANDLLYLFTADSLTGAWHPHPGNPVSHDVRAARGAGKLFRVGDKLVRPAQDCSVRYGYATQLNEVEVLTPQEFREKPLLRIEPDWAPGLIGTHTINSNDIVEVIDGQVYRAKYRR